MGCILTAGVLRSRRKLLWGLGVILAWGLALAALCDYIENITLVFLLFDRVQSPFPEIAGVCVVIKFTLIIIAAIYILYGLASRILSRPTRDLKPEP
jgi:hypothetical protein